MLGHTLAAAAGPACDPSTASVLYYAAAGDRCRRLCVRKPEMLLNTDDLRIQKTNELISPEQLISDIAVSDTARATDQRYRRQRYRL